MFFGAVPEHVIQQVFKIIDFSEWSEIYVCCSGGFRIERALLQLNSNFVVRSNDVSLFSGAIAELALGQEFPLKFHGQLEWVEGELAKGTFIERVAAMLVAFDMARHSTGSRNRYKDAHVAEYRRTFKELIEKTAGRLENVTKQMPIASYAGCDWRKHVDEAIEKGAGIAAFPPFFRGDYEKQFEFIHKNVEWPAPTYDIYDPKTLGDIVDRIEASGVPFCILTDQHLEGRQPVIEYVTGRKVPHFCYASTEHSSYRHFVTTQEQFPHLPVNLSKLSEKTQIRVVEADHKQVNWIKDIYLQRSIVHTSGMMNFFVYLDDMLLGALVYTLAKYPTYNDDETQAIYLLSDVTTTRDGKLSKLVARLASSNTVLRKLNIRYLNRFNLVVTTARTHNPVSMKYRGIYELLSRRPSDNPDEGNILQYGRRATDETPEEMYSWWWKRYGQKEVERLQRNRGA